MSNNRSSIKITTIKPSDTIGTIGSSLDGFVPTGIHPYHLGQSLRRIKILGPVPQHLQHANLGFDILDDYAILEDSKKKVKPTYRSIDSEWEPTKKYE